MIKRYILGYAAISAFVFSLIVHIISIMGINIVDRIPPIWLIHIVIFILFILVFKDRRSSKTRGKLRDAREHIPPLVILIMVLLLIYSMANFFICNSEEGFMVIKGGRFILTIKGRFIRGVSEEEYTAWMAKELRGFSGHWMFFSFIAAVPVLFDRNMGVKK